MDITKSDTKVPGPDIHQRPARYPMLWTALLSVLTYFVPFFIYIFLELRSDRVHPYRGENYTFRDYICEVLLQAISRALHLVTHLLKDLAQPLLLLVNTEQQATWLIILLMGQQMMAFLTLNIATILFFMPLEFLATLICSLQTRFWDRYLKCSGLLASSRATITIRRCCSPSMPFWRQRTEGIHQCDMSGQEFDAFKTANQLDATTTGLTAIEI